MGAAGRRQHNWKAARSGGSTMFWLGMILAMILAQSLQGWNKLGFRITVLSSLVANFVVGFLSGTRRHLPHRFWWALLGEVAKFVLWLAYQATEATSTNAIGSLSLSDSDASSEEKQVAAFWGSFLLLHLGGPDNLTAYALEDNKISKRKWLEIFFQILGVFYAIYKNTHRGARSWALLPAASGVMLIAGAVRYWERAKALGKANLDSMQEDASASSSTSNSQDDDDKKKKKTELLECKIRRVKRQGRLICDGEALLLAQDLFPVWRHALVDSSVDPTSPTQEARVMILSVSESDELERKWDWESMCKVAEMELSLIYEFLYTKAILARTWHYYLIRLLSPLFTAAATFLFYFWLQQQGHGVRGSFVGITYALLAITFLMDVAWLLRAIGSTWAYAYFELTAAGTRRRWWCSIHHIIVCLDPLQLFGRDPVSHRLWSGTIGRYNLLDECTATTTFLPEWWPVSKELGYLSKLPQCVKEVLFKRVTKILQLAIKNTEEEGGDQEEEMYSRLDIRKHWGHKAFSRAPEEVINRFKKDKVDPFGEEFEEDVLLWHITTCMLLVRPDIRGQKGRRRILACAIEVMSEYMMFLVAVRRQMLPGLVLHSQLQVTREKLKDILEKGEDSKVILSNRDKLSMNNKEKLATILRYIREVKKGEENQLMDGDIILGNEGTQLLVHAVELYFHLSGDERPTRESRTAPWSPPRLQDEMLKIIFNVWVDKLVYAAIRCSREAHAEQLSSGGDLTTVVWMLIQHAGPFSVRAANITFQPPTPQPEEERPHLPQAKPPKESQPQPPLPPPPPPPPRPPMAESPPGTSPWPRPPPMAGLMDGSIPLPPPSPLPPCCPVCPPYYHPSYPPVCPPCYDPSWPPVCPWYPQCPPQHERPGDEPEEAREDEHEESSSSDEDSESEE